MHASHAIHFAFVCILSLVQHFFTSLSSNYSHSFGFPYLSVAFSGLAACVPGPIDSSLDVPPQITLLDLNHLPDCIAWRWHLFQSYFFLRDTTSCLGRLL
jgi:hypothetical protein